MQSTLLQRWFTAKLLKSFESFTFLYCSNNSQCSIQYINISRICSVATFRNINFACVMNNQSRTQDKSILHDESLALIHHNTSSGIIEQCFSYPDEHGKPIENVIKLRSSLLNWTNAKDFRHSFSIESNAVTINGTFLGEDDEGIHREVYCNRCVDQESNGSFTYAPIQGMRYKCLTCDNYDCCTSCFKLFLEIPCGFNNHKYAKISNPLHEPDYLLVANYSESLVNVLLNYSSLPFIGYFKNNNFNWISYREVYNLAMAFGSGLRNIGVCARDCVFISATNSLDYVICDIACGIYGFVLVGISPYMADEDIIAICSQAKTISKCSVIITCAITSKRYLPLIRQKPFREGDPSSAASSLEGIDHMIVIGETNYANYCDQVAENANKCMMLDSTVRSAAIASISVPNVIVCTFVEVCRDLNVVLRLPQTVKANDLVAIAFTSGTSKGAPKGLPISVADRMKVMRKYAQSYYQMRVSTDVAMITTSLNYSASREEVLYLMMTGGQAAIFTKAVDGIEELLYELNMLRPTFVSGMPAFWSAIYNRYCYEKLQLENTINSNDVPKAVDLNSLNIKYSRIFGNRCVTLSTGSSHTPAKVIDFMKRVLTNSALSEYPPCHVFDSYGAMECGGIACNEKFFKGVEWRLLPQETPQEVKYESEDSECFCNKYVDRDDSRSSHDVVRYGELLVRTSRMLGGYLLSSGSISRFSSDGFFCTGDLVQLSCPCGAMSSTLCSCDRLGGPQVRVVGRVVSMVKLSDGEFFSPEIVEGILAECPHVLDAFVYADISWDSCAAVIVLSDDKQSALTLGSHQDMAEIEQMVFTEIFDLIKNGRLQNKHAPIGLVLRTSPFTVESGLRTISCKKSRQHLTRKFYSALKQKYLEKKQSSTEQTVVSILSSVLEYGADTPNTKHYVNDTSKMWSLGLNSLSTLAAASSISKQLGVPQEISLNMVLNSQNAKDISCKISEFKMIANANSNDKQNCNINLNSWRTVALDDINWLPTAVSPTVALFGSNTPVVQCIRNTPPHCINVLLTGACGFLGSAILGELLFRSGEQYNVFALTRSKSNKTAYRRVIDRLLEHELAACCDSLNRLEVIEGDLSEPYFGLSSANYDLLQSKVDMCIHTAAKTIWTASYMQLRDCNVKSALNVISFSLSNRFKIVPLCHISTQSAELASSGGCLNLPQSHSHYANLAVKYISNASIESGYIASKIVCECLVRKAHEKYGLPLIIIRPGTISAHSANGYSNRTDFSSRFIMSLQRRPEQIPTLEKCFGGIDLACIDFVAREICQLVGSTSFIGDTYCICNPISTTYVDIAHAVIDNISAQSSNQLPLTQWLDVISNDTKDPLHPLHHCLLELLQCVPQSHTRYSSSSICMEVPKWNELSYKCPLFVCREIIPLILKWHSEKLLI